MKNFENTFWNMNQCFQLALFFAEIRYFRFTRIFSTLGFSTSEKWMLNNTFCRYFFPWKKKLFCVTIRKTKWRMNSPVQELEENRARTLLRKEKNKKCTNCSGALNVPVGANFINDVIYWRFCCEWESQPVSFAARHAILGGLNLTVPQISN